LLADTSPVQLSALQRHLPEALGLGPADAMPGPMVSAKPQVPLVREYLPADSHEVAVLQAALARHGGNQSRAAQSLGLTLRQLGYRLRKAGLR
jgi:Nif-specific regulatory protein